MKRFLVFAGDVYYPCGGWEDLVDQFDTLQEARGKADEFNEQYSWAHIVDTETGEQL